jgi:DHA1 family inner membrane transport protein
MPLALVALAAASFCIGTTEFVIMGLLPNVARDLGVTIPQAGLLVTGYALGVVVGAPIVAALVVAVPRKRALLGMVVVFAIGNALCAIAPNYAALLGARVVTAFCHGAFFGIGSVVAAQLVAPERRAQAIALMFAGLTLANVLGVPFGTALGNAAGWRSTFWAVAAIGVLAALAVALWVPRSIVMSHPDLHAELRVVARPQVIFAMAISVFASASLFSVFTYITPLLEGVTRLTPWQVTLALLIFGAGLTVGNLGGGRLADWKLMPSLIGATIAVALVMLLFAWTSRWIGAAFVTLFVWGILAFAMVPLLQLRIVDEAADAPNLAATLNQGAFNLGNALGAWIGGAAITAGVAYGELPWLGAGIALLALATALGSIRLDAAERLRPAA